MQACGESTPIDDSNAVNPVRVVSPVTPQHAPAAVARRRASAPASAWASLGGLCACLVAMPAQSAQTATDTAGAPVDLADLSVEQLEQYALDDLLNLRVTAASQHEIPALWSPSAISVYTGDEVRASGALTLSDFLRRVPGLDIYMVEHGYSLIAARSLADLGNNRILLIVDGREEIVETGGFPSPGALSLCLQLIDRIEVVRGPASVLYGPNAFLGVISVTTIRPAADLESGTEADASVQVGTLRSRQLFARARHALRLSRGWLESEARVGQTGLGTPSDPDYLQLMPYRLDGRVRFAHDNGTDVSVLAGASRVRFAMPTPWGELDMRRGQQLYLTGEAAAALGARWRLSTRAYLNHFEGHAVPRFAVGFRGMPVADTLPQTYAATAVDGHVRLSYETADLLLTLGSLVRRTHGRGSTWGEGGDDESRAGVFGHAQWHTSVRTQWVGGLRFDTSSAFGAVLTPRLGFTYRTGPRHALRITAQFGARKPYPLEHGAQAEYEVRPQAAALLPPGFDLQGASESIGNANLRYEIVQSVEVGWQGRFRESGLDVGAELFVNRFVDVIGVTNPQDLQLGMTQTEFELVRYTNADAAYFAVGGELEARWQHPSGWRLWGNLTVRSGWKEPETSWYLATTDPRLRVNAGGGYAPAQGAVVDVAAHYVSRYEAECFDVRDVAVNLSQTLGNAALVLARVGYRFGPVLRAVTSLELGATVQLPVPGRHREYLGDSANAWQASSAYDTVTSDTLAEEQVPRVSVHLRAQH